MNVKPFVKWVGGKRQLLAKITPLIPEAFTRYVEPFTGGGAVFFSLSQRLQEGLVPAWLNDINPELVNAYHVVRDAPDELLADLRTHIHSKDYFLSLRSLDRQAGGLSSLSPIKRASRFIYLNRTAFNGMYRVNAKGQFNVPFGRYKNPAIADADTIYSCSKMLQKVEISCSGFEGVLPQTGAGDFVYLDPPYIPLNKTGYFTSYSDTGFVHTDQITLVELIRDMDERGVRFIASNAFVPELRDMYSGFTILEVKATRAINANKDGRHAISEALITNIL